MNSNFDLRKFLTENKLTRDTITKPLNEDFIELSVLSEPIDALLKGFEEWYSDTVLNWDDIWYNMEEQSPQEAAKAAQTEILTYLSSKMNEKIQELESKM